MLSTMFRTSFWLAVRVFAAMAFLAPADSVVATGKKGATPQQVLNHQQLADSIHTLHTARLTLQMADHDYGGHRAAAVHDINKSIKQLNLVLHHGKKGKSGQPKKGKGAKPMEPQAVSDAQLAATIPALRQTQALLLSSPNDYGGHRAKAVTDLDAAVTRLDAALKFSAAKNQNKQ